MVGLTYVLGGKVLKITGSPGIFRREEDREKKREGEGGEGGRGGGGEKRKRRRRKGESDKDRQGKRRGECLKKNMEAKKK